MLDKERTDSEDENNSDKGQNALIKNENENRRVAYQQVCESYRAIDNFRMKLLGLLPLASGAGIFLLLNDALTDPKKRKIAEEFLLPIGLFGFVVTLGLFVYEFRGIEKCIKLINDGRKIERKWTIEGQFFKRPSLSLRSIIISKPSAAGIIYPAVLVAWLYVAFLPQFECWIAGIVFLLGFLAPVIYYYWLLKKSNDNEQERSNSE